MSLLILLAIASLNASSSAATAPVLTHRYTYHVPFSADQGVGIAVGSGGDVFVAGRVGSGCGGTGDVYVCRLDPVLTRKWETVVDVGGCRDNYPTGIAVKGDVSYVSGYGVNSFGDGFVVKVDGSGVQRWTASPSLAYVGFLDIIVDPSDGSIGAVGTSPNAYGEANAIVYQYLDHGSTYTFGHWMQLVFRSNEIAVGMAAGPRGILVTGTDDGAANRDRAVCNSLKSMSDDTISRLWMDGGAVESFGKSVGCVNARETFLLFSRTYAGCPVSLVQLETGATVEVHHSGSGSLPDKGRIAVHPTLPLIVVADGPALKGYDTSLKLLWEASVSNLTNPVFHGVVLGPGLPLTVYAVAESAGVGGTQIDVIRLDGADPVAEKGGFVAAPNKVDRTGVRPYSLLLLRGTPGGAVKLRVYDVAGHLVATLDSTLDDTGRGEVRWYVDGSGGAPSVQAGTYWIVADGGGVSGKKPVAVVGK